jgi:hypothetical protein
VADVKRKILDISLAYGASVANCVAFEVSDLYSRLEGGLLKNGYVLFGDNAYLNSLYMATPYSNVSGNPNKKVKTITIFSIHSCASAWNVLLACLWLDGGH